MYYGSDEFNNAIENTQGNALKTRLKFSDEEIIELVSSMRYYGGSNDTDDLSIGNVAMAYVEVSAFTNKMLTGREFLLESGVKLSDGTYEYAPIGYFTVQTPSGDYDEVVFKAYDRMLKFEKPYSSSLTYPTDSVAILNELCTICGIELATSIDEPITIADKLDGYTCREILSYIAGIHGFFACIDRFGKLNLRWYSDTPIVKSLKSAWSFEKSQELHEIEKIEVAKDSETTFTSGDGVKTLYHSNPYATQDIVDKLYEKLGGYSYMPGEVEMLDDIRLDPWDVIQITYLDNKTYQIPAMVIEHDFGASSTTIRAVGKIIENEYHYTGPTTNYLNRMSTELLITNRVVASKVDAEYVKAHAITTDNLDAIQANIKNAVIEDIDADYIKTNQLDAIEAEIQTAILGDVRAEFATIEQLNTQIAKTNELDANVANINTLIFGSAAGSVIQTSFANAVIAQLGNAQIESAMIHSVSADKITAGTIYTDDVTIKSKNGQMILSDNTMQISDGTRVRVQIGKDASNDYSINIWDENGNLMFSEGGITDNAIKEAIIRNDMVSESANINASKLDIDSLFSEINGSTNTIKATKVYFDSEKQTLDIAFDTMTSTVDYLQDTLSSQGTEISVIQGQIDTKIWQQDIDSTIGKMNIGAKNLIREMYIVNFQGQTNKSQYITSGTITHTSAHVHGGFKFDSILCYEPNTEYVLSGYVTVTTGPVGNFYIYNGKKHVFKSFSIDGVKSGSPLDSGVTAFNTILDDGKKHYFELHFVTASSIPVDSDANYTYFQLGKYFDSEVAYTISGLKLEKGNKATDWSPAPEDVDGKITTLSTQYSELVMDLSGFKSTVSTEYTTLEDFHALSIGGRNLFLDTKTMTTTNKNIAISTTITVEDDGTGYSIATLPADSKWDSINFYFQESIENIGGKEVTISFDAKSDGLTSATAEWMIYAAGFNDSDSRGKYQWLANLESNAFNVHEYVDGQWVRCKATFTLPTIDEMAKGTANEHTKYGIQIFSTTDNTTYSLQVRKVKCEYGNMATDWTPAPEDVETDIVSVKTIATQNAEKFNWLVSGESETSFTLTDRMAELTTQLVSLNADVQISGDMILEGAITADKIAIGDFTNLAMTNPDSYNPYSHTIMEDASGVKWFQFGSDTILGYYTIYMNTISNQATFKKGDKYLFRGLVRASQTTSVRVCLRAFYTDSGYINMASAFYDNVTTEAQYVEIPFEVVSLPAKPVKYYRLFLETRNTKLGILYARELSVHQMTGNVLIADGSITAEKLYVEDLSALNATIGGWKIATKYISNDALDSEGYVRRAFIQSMSAHEAEDTWVFSVQKSKELGDYEGTFSSVWRVLGSGDMYSEGLISVGGYVYAGEHISTGGYISAEDYVLAQNFIRTKSYLRVDDVLKVYGGTEDGSYSFIQGKLSLGTTSYNNDYTLLVSGNAKISGDLNLLGTFLGNVSTLGDVVTSEGASLNSLNSRFKWYSSSYVSTSHKYVLMDAGFYAIVLIDSLSTTVRSKPSFAILYADGTGNGWVNFWQGTGSELYYVGYNNGLLQMTLEEERYLSMGYINLKQ